MKFKIFIICIYLFVNLHSNVIASIEDGETIKNAKNVVLFKFSDDNKIAIFNQHRIDVANHKNPTLQLTLDGIEIDKAVKLTDESWSLNLNDQSIVNLTAKEKDTDTTDYLFNWKGGKQNINRKVCFHYAHDHASWYHTYQSLDPKWPMDPKEAMKKYPFNSIFDWDWDATSNEFCCKLEHMFVNTNGFGILLHETSPWFIERDSSDKQLCFSVNNTAPYMKNSDPAYLDIQIHLFASKNIRTVTDYIVTKSGLLPKPTEIPNERLFKYPSWMTYSQGKDLTQSDLIKFTDKIVKHGFSNQSKIIIDSNWEKNRGEFEFNSKNYPNVGHMILDITKQGFLPSVQLFGLVNNDQEPAAKFFTEQYFIKDPKTGGQIKDNHFLDYSQPDSTGYYKFQLDKMKYNFGISSFQVNLQSPGKIYFNVTDKEVQKQPVLLAKKYLETINLASNTNHAYFAYKTQNLKMFLQIHDNYSNNVNLSQMLQNVVSSVLPLSISGYSFLAPYLIGGPSATQKPSENVYIRWVQAAALMPSMVFFHAPWDISENALKITQKFVNFHEEYSQTFIDLAKKRLTSGQPIIRPMWYEAPDDPESYKVNDQFMLGDNIIVAPNLNANVFKRSVYLPKGNWLDMVNNNTVTGPRYNTFVPIEELLYFIKQSGGATTQSLAPTAKSGTPATKSGAPTTKSATPKATTPKAPTTNTTPHPG